MMTTTTILDLRPYQKPRPGVLVLVELEGVLNTARHSYLEKDKP